MYCLCYTKHVGKIVNGHIYNHSILPPLPRCSCQCEHQAELASLLVQKELQIWHRRHFLYIQLL